ncbi:MULTISPECIES: hypothetical protein [unclassified Thioclava]|uniref:hypothetical protein n=1 Tax=unclassified Thioclava TaxID=2621713 RepID=UPI0009968EC1|nr:MULTISPECIES: hypothetical protein [unclassified Thioclava]MPQ92800.1 hypothetical protein [Thioclava sp. JE_KL1]OOY03796.1 hypothetical protein BMI87_15385 [Thioclava sp. F28-4]
MNRYSLIVTLAALTLAGCATTDVQPMSRDTFKIDTHAAPACGPTGARNVAFRAAAIEVIRRGGDKFIIMGDRSDMGMQGDIFSGFNTNYAQGMVVRMIPEGSPEARNALSAREQLGADWQELVSKGVPNTCT